MKLDSHCGCTSVIPLVAPRPRRSKQRLGHPAAVAHSVNRGHSAVSGGSLTMPVIPQLERKGSQDQANYGESGEPCQRLPTSLRWLFTDLAQHPAPREPNRASSTLPELPAWPAPGFSRECDTAS